MHVFIRTDASLNIGTGHLMRTLTLADRLQSYGHKVTFLTRTKQAGLMHKIESAGHSVHTLKEERGTQGKVSSFSDIEHADWLEVDQDTDADETIECVSSKMPDWIVVDHYSLDIRWEKRLRPYCKNILVIDDLADRAHDCDILVDQNLGKTERSYNGLVPLKCELLIGPKYALLRPEFGQWRDTSLRRRMSPKVNKVMITMGGSDKENYTLAILSELQKQNASKNVQFLVIVGEMYPFMDTLRNFADSTTLKLKIYKNIENMSELMAKCDLCIGAAGSTAWERMCLGLPCLTVILANNQKPIAFALADLELSEVTSVSEVGANFTRIVNEPDFQTMKKLTSNSLAICDGEGSEKIVLRMQGVVS